MSMRTRFLQLFSIGLLVYWLIGLLAYSPVFAQSPIPFIAIGDSITAGTSGASSYLCPLSQSLGSNVMFQGPNVVSSCPNVHNAAFDGASTQDILDKRNLWLSSIPEEGNAIVFVMLGTNDYYARGGFNAQSFQTNLTSLVTLIRQRNPQVRITLSTIVPSKDSLMDAPNRVINTVGSQYGIEVIPAGNNFDRNSYITPNSEDPQNKVHPNTDGARIIALNLISSINAQLAALPQPTDTQHRQTDLQSGGAQPPAPQQNAPQTGYNTGMAVGLTLPGGITINGPAGLKFATIADVLNRAIPFVFAVAGIGLLVILLSAGFEFLTSAGDAKKLETAQQRLTYAVVGFLVIFTAYWMVQIAGRIFGLTEVQTIFK